MKLSRRTLLGMVAACLASGGARADGDSDAPDARLAHALAEVARARSSLKTLTGPFTQTRTIGLLTAKVRSTGTLTLERPDRLRWELAPPDEIVYWVMPEGLAYRSRTGQGIVRSPTTKVAALLSDLRIVLGGDLSQLTARYALTVTGEDGAPLIFEATPKPGTTAPIQKLMFTLGPDRSAPQSTTLVEGPRDRTDIVFGALERNVVVDPARVRPDF